MRSRLRARILALLVPTLLLVGPGSTRVLHAQQPASSSGRCADRPVIVSHGPGAVVTRIVGRVVDATTGSAVQGAVLVLGADSVGRVITDDDGGFRIDGVTPGAYELAVSGPSYGTQASCLEIPADQEVTLTIGLHPRPINVEPLAVSVEGARPLWLVHEGFYRRRRAGGGIFITRDDILKKNPSRLSEMFVGRAEVTVADGNPSPLQPIQAVHPPPGVPGRSCPLGNPRMCRRPQDTGPCPVQYLVDGDPVPLILGVDTFHPKDVAAIEAYFHASEVPPQFNVGTAACGVINIWLKVHADGH